MQSAVFKNDLVGVDNGVGTVLQGGENTMAETRGI
jgi:hypothetical protein